MADSTVTRRFSLTPAWLIYGLLVVEGLLWLSERCRWFWFNEKKGWTVLIGVAVVAVAMLAMLVWFIVALVFRWRFQFSIRSLLLLTVTVAIPFSWLAVEMKETREQRAAADELAKLGGFVVYDWQVDANANPLPNAHQPGPPWLQGMLGDGFLSNVVWFSVLSHMGMGYDPQHMSTPTYDQSMGYTGNPDIKEAAFSHLDRLIQLKWLDIHDTQTTDATLEHLAGLTRLRTLRLGHTHITDTGLMHIERLTELQGLLLEDTTITDAGLRHLTSLTALQYLNLRNSKIMDTGLGYLRDLKNLQRLDLGNTKISDTGLEQLAGLTQLSALDLAGTHITNGGLEYLIGLKRLSELNLVGTRVTDAGMSRLKQSLPNCQISHGGIPCPFQ